MRFFSKRLTSFITLCLTLLCSTPQWPTASFASDPEPVASDPVFNRDLPRDSELLLLKGEETYRTGQFLGTWRHMLFLKTFDPGQGLYQTEQIAFDQITKVQWIQHHRSFTYPVGLGLLMGGIGALAGYNSVNTRQIGDYDYPDQRGQAALVFGVTGFAVGFLIGAGIAPQRRTATTVWARN